jgi:hypothetical protein
MTASAAHAQIGVENHPYQTQNRRVQASEPRSKRQSLVVVLAWGALSLACTGRIEGPTGDPLAPPGTGSGPGAGAGTGSGPNPGEPGVGEPPPTSVPEASPCKSNSPGPRALRRLTAAEYEATLRDIFDDPNVPLTSVFSDPSVLGFTVDQRALVVQGLGAQQLMDQAESVASWAVKNKMHRLTSCTSNDAACRGTLIRQLGKRLHRAPLSDADVAIYEGLFTAEPTFEAGVEAVTSAMLQSPYFLYRRELGTPDGDQHRLSSHELASALSYLMTGSMPDDELMAAADSDALSQPAELERHADRLLQSPRGHQAVYNFMRDWLGLSKLETVAKDETIFKLTDSLRSAMGEETRRVIDDAVFNQNASFLSLLTTPASFVNRELGQHYGLTGADGFGDELVPITLEAGKRDNGLLAHGSLLTALATASESSPVQRGKMVRVRLLCHDIPPPPANVDTALKPAAGAMTTREHFAEHASNKTCASCHKLMDPIGFGFEHYDAFGRRREQENGHAIDASGAIVLPEGGEVAFNGVPGLTDYLVNQAGDAVQACMVRHLSYFAFGLAGWEQDQCTYDAIAEHAEQDGFALRSVVKALVKTTHFSSRVSD